MIKNILLLPTTDNIVSNWKNVYLDLTTKGFNTYIIADNINITKDIPTGLKKIDFFASRLLQLDTFTFIQKIILFLYIRKYANHILHYYKIDIVIVSNDNAPVQNIFVNAAKKLGITTVLHQAAGILAKPTPNSFIKRIKIKVTKKLFGISSSKNIGSNVDFCLIQGIQWTNYIDNKNFKIIGNQFYRDLLDILKKVPLQEVQNYKKKYHLNKKTITFFSQPFKELSICSINNIDQLYTDLLNLQTLLEKQGIYEFIFKPHPQESYYKNFNFHKIINDTDLNSLILASDICITVFSTVAIQTKIASKTTIGFTPNYLPSDILKQMENTFDFKSSSITELFNFINDENHTSNHNFNDIVDMTCDTKIEVYNFIRENTL